MFERIKRLFTNDYYEMALVNAMSATEQQMKNCKLNSLSRDDVMDNLLDYLHNERDTWYRCAHEPGMDSEYQAYCRGRYVTCEALESFVDEMIKSRVNK